MPNLVVYMNPVASIDIFEEIESNNFKKISQVKQPLDFMKFLANYMTNIKEKIEIGFVGPTDYTGPWVVEANQFNLVKAYQMKKE